MGHLRRQVGPDCAERIDLASTILINRSGSVADELREACLVVASDTVSRTLEFTASAHAVDHI